MDSYTLGDIKKSVRGLLDDPDFDGDTIAEAANWVVYELFASYRLRMAESSDTIQASQGDTQADFPSDLLTRITIWGTSPVVVNAKNFEMAYDDFMINHAGFATAAQARFREWTEFGNAMRFSAPLQENTVFQVDYLRTPDTMEDDGDDCEIGRIYSELVSKLTLARIMEINEDYEEARQERNNAAPQLTTFIRNEARGGGKTGPQKIRTNRGRVGGYRVDRDF